jgi:hypothetical protein
MAQDQLPASSPDIASSRASLSDPHAVTSQSLRGRHDIVESEHTSFFWPEVDELLTNEFSGDALEQLRAGVALPSPPVFNGFPSPPVFDAPPPPPVFNGAPPLSGGDLVPPHSGGRRVFDEPTGAVPIVAPVGLSADSGAPAFRGAHDLETEVAATAGYVPDVVATPAPRLSRACGGAACSIPAPSRPTTTGTGRP